MTQKRLFISHSTKNDKEVDRIADWLEQAGFTVWVDHRNGIMPGTPSWEKAIRKAIIDADAGIFVMSQDSLDSEICGSECLLVRELDDPLYVLKLEEVANENIWLYIKQIQYADLSTGFDKGMESLANALNGKATADGPQALQSRFTGRSTLHQYLPYVFTNPMRGRDEDLQRLTESLNGVIQVTGTGGLGKSRLVAELALSHPAGAVWHRCSEISSPANVWGLLLEHLRLPKESDETTILNQLKLRPHTLIVIDNAESVPEAQQAPYRELIAKLQSADAHVVLTSRKRWEALKPLKEITPSALDVESAIAITQDFAKSDDITLTEEQAQALAQAARRYPRLIEWAVGQLAKRSFSRVISQLDELKSPNVQEALEEMIRSSLQQMRQEEGDSGEALLRHLVVFQGDFDEEALFSLKPDTFDDDAVDQALDALQAWRFVRFDRNQARYSVDEMVRLSLPKPDAALQQKHFDYYHDLHSDYDLNRAYAEDGSMLRHALLTHDWENILSAIEWGFEHESEKAVDWVIALQVFMMLRRSSQEREALLDQSLTIATETTYDWGQANCLKALGDVQIRKDDYDEAQNRYLQALTLYQTLDDPLSQAQCLHALGDVYRMKNDYDEAQNRYLQALTLLQTLGDRLGQAHCLHALGDVEIIKNDYDKAQNRYLQALTLYQTLGDRLGQAHCLKTLGDVYYMKDDYDKAQNRYLQALTLYQTISAPLGQANCLRALGDVHRMRNQYDDAQNRYQQALSLFQTIGERLGQANCLQALGDVHYMKDNYDDAQNRYQQALSLFQTIGARLGQANCLKALGDVHRMRNQHDDAIQHYTQAIELGQVIGEFIVQLNSLNGLARSHHAQNDLAQACHYATALLTLASSHPFFATHDITRQWQEEFAAWGCD